MELLKEGQFALSNMNFAFDSNQVHGTDRSDQHYTHFNLDTTSSDLASIKVNLHFQTQSQDKLMNSISLNESKISTEESEIDGGDELGLKLEYYKGNQSR